MEMLLYIHAYEYLQQYGGRNRGNTLFFRWYQQLETPLLLKIGNRIRTIVDGQRGKDQTGFRLPTGIEDVFIIFECIFGKNLEWNAPLCLQAWI